MRLKIKGKAGSAIVNVDDDSITVTELAQLVKTSTSLGEAISFKFGFPPKTVDATATTSLKEIGVRPNEQLTVEVSSVPSQTPNSASEDHNPKRPKVEPKTTKPVPDIAHTSIGSQYLLLRNVPDDNSCLFNAVSYALRGTFKLPDINLREIVAETIRSNPDTYDETVLGRPLEKYCHWIETSDAWGGAIELGILASFLDIRINCFDVELGGVMVFQDETNRPRKFINLVYSGIHYDCIVQNNEITEKKSNDQGFWEENEDSIVSSCKELVKLLQLRNYTTNTTTFRVRCLVCYEVLVGEMGASKHANEKKHYLFGEVN